MRSPKASAAASQVSRLAIILFISGIAAACSNTGRFAENPFANPFASKGAVDRSPVGSVNGAKAAPLTQAQPLPPAVTGSAQAMSTIGNGSSKGWSAAGGTPVTLAQGESIMTLSNRYGVPPQAILSANGLTSASQVKPGQQLIMPVYASGAASAAAPGRCRENRFSGAAKAGRAGSGKTN